MGKITIDGGKYTIVNELNDGGGLRALRNGEEWRDLTGDGMVLAMYHEIEQLQTQISEADSLLSGAHDLMDNVHCYDTDEYHAISRYFNGDDSE